MEIGNMSFQKGGTSCGKMDLLLINVKAILLRDSLNGLGMVYLLDTLSLTTGNLTKGKSRQTFCLSKAKREHKLDWRPFASNEKAG